MKATIEISLYPLNKNYKKIVLAFIDKLQKSKKVQVETNGLSTQIFGDYNVLMKLLSTEIKKVLEQQPSVFVFKIAKGELRFKKD